VSILDKLKQDFIAVRPVVVPQAKKEEAKKEDVVIAEQSTTLQQSTTLCKNCNGKHFWQPVRSESWRCYVCSPPPVQAMVAKERGGPVQPAAAVQAAAVTARLVVLKIYYCRSEQCDICGGRMVSETTYDDNGFSIHCLTCGSLLG